MVGLPIPPPDFTESQFASREPAADWAGVVSHGGPLRGFDRLMPAFGDALSREEIDLILEYVQTLYEDKSWPRGEFNLPLSLGTEKAFPEDEVVMKTTVGTGDAGSVMNKLIYEKRFGSQTQIEVVVPFGWQESFLNEDLRVPRPSGDWAGGVGDLAIGLKRVLFHNLGMGTITSFTFETILPTGNEDEGLREGLHRLRTLRDRGPTPAGGCVLPDPDGGGASHRHRQGRKRRALPDGPGEDLHSRWGMGPGHFPHGGVSPGSEGVRRGHGGLGHHARDAFHPEPAPAHHGERRCPLPPHGDGG